MRSFHGWGVLSSVNLPESVLRPLLMGIWVVSLVELLHIVCGCEHSCESLVNMYVQF